MLLLTWLSSQINSKGFLDFLLAVYQRAEKEKAAKPRKILKSDFKMAENEILISTIISLDNSFSEKDNINIKDEVNNQEDKNTREQEHISEPEASQIRFDESFCTKNKLIQIL